MNRRCMEVPEAAGRTLESLRVYDDPPYGREVHLTFTDGTQMSIDLEIETVVKSKHYRVNDGGLEVLEQHEGRSVPSLG